MRDRLSYLPLACGFILGLLFISHANGAPAQTLYRVELMVLAYPAGGAAEQWEAMPKLAYPASVRFLRNQGGMAQPVGGAGQHPEPSATGAAPGSLLQPAPATFDPLPHGEREFGSRTASMQASGRYRILFHEAWVQPLSTQSAAIPIVLDHSGEGGAWPELQGAITFYLAGDFFVATNLWLNTEGEYLPGTWRMPPPPRGPQADVPVQSDATASAQELAGGSGASPLEVNGDYPYRHAVLLQQSRRLRGGEVFYIDHPMLAVAVKISPLDTPTSASKGAGENPPPPGPAP